MRNHPLLLIVLVAIAAAWLLHRRKSAAPAIIDIADPRTPVPMGPPTASSVVGNPPVPSTATLEGTTGREPFELETWGSHAEESMAPHRRRR